MNGDSFQVKAILSLSFPSNMLITEEIELKRTRQEGALRFGTTAVVVYCETEEKMGREGRARKRQEEEDKETERCREIVSERRSEQTTSFRINRKQR